MEPCGHRAYDQGMETDVTLVGDEFACGGKKKRFGASCEKEPDTFAGYPGDQTGPQKKLIDYWVHGGGAAKVNWGSPGGFTRCVAQLGPKLRANSPGVDVKGMCANLHKAATGKWPNEHRPGGE